MTEFREQRLSGVHVERVSLRDTTMHDVELSGAQVRDALFRRSRLRDVQLIDLEISGDLHNVVVNGVDIAPLVEAELNRRTPERAKMWPDDSDGCREAWAILERLWESTLERARALPEAALHRSVDDEFSFIQTLRHLNFASAAWVERMILGDASPWHPLDLPWDGAPAGEGLPQDREAQPTLDEVLAIRRRRQATVRQVMASLTDEQLAVEVTRPEPGYPRNETFPVKKCLHILLTHEWEHRFYAERDVTTLA